MSHRITISRPSWAPLLSRRGSNAKPIGLTVSQTLYQPSYPTRRNGLSLNWLCSNVFLEQFGF
jgi:hypothetical protein